MRKKKFKQRIVICGNMSSYNLFLQVKNILINEGFNVVIPNSDEETSHIYQSINYKEYKRKSLFNYLKIIKDPSTRAILVINPKKYSMDNYIGATTFAEIAVAFAQKKKVYLLYTMPPIYEDELFSWDVISLNGDLDILKKDLNNIINDKNKQLSLFDLD